MKRITTADFRDHRRDRFIDAQTTPAARYRTISVVATIPAKPMVALLLRPLLQDRHPLTGPVKANTSRCAGPGACKKIGKNRLAIERIGCVLR